MRDINDRMGDPYYTSAEDRQALVDHTMRRADNMRNTLDEDISTGVIDEEDKNRYLAEIDKVCADGMNKINKNSRCNEDGENRD